MPHILPTSYRSCALVLSVYTKVRALPTRLPKICPARTGAKRTKRPCGIISAISRTAARDLRNEMAGFPALPDEGLRPPEEAGRLLASAVPGRVDRGVSERIIAQTGGNPLALIELGGELTGSSWRGRFCCLTCSRWAEACRHDTFARSSCLRRSSCSTCPVTPAACPPSSCGAPTLGSCPGRSSCNAAPPEVAPPLPRPEGRSVRRRRLGPGCRECLSQHYDANGVAA